MEPTLKWTLEELQFCGLHGSESLQLLIVVQGTGEVSKLLTPVVAVYFFKF